MMLNAILTFKILYHNFEKFDYNYKKKTIVFYYATAHNTLEKFYSI